MRGYSACTLYAPCTVLWSMKTAIWQRKNQSVHLCVQRFRVHAFACISSAKNSCSPSAGWKRKNEQLTSDKRKTISAVHFPSVYFCIEIQSAASKWITWNYQHFLSLNETQTIFKKRNDSTLRFFKAICWIFVFSLAIFKYFVDFHFKISTIFFLCYLRTAG